MLHHTGQGRGRLERGILLLALKSRLDCEGMGGGHGAGTRWVSTPPDGQQEEGISTLQPQGPELWRQLYEPEEGPSSGKDHRPNTLACCLVKPWTPELGQL